MTGVELTMWNRQEETYHCGVAGNGVRYFERGSSNETREEQEQENGKMHAFVPETDNYTLTPKIREITK